MTEQSPLEMARRVFSGLKGAKMSGDSNWVKPGLYWCRLDNVKLDETRKNGAALFVEMTVVHVLDDDNGLGHKLGESCTHGMFSKFDSFLGNVKQFISGTLGVAPDEVEEQHIFDIIEADQPLQGTVVEVQARQIITREKGNKFTKVNYKQEIQAKDLLATLDEDAQRIYFPDNVLERFADLDNEED